MRHAVGERDQDLARVVFGAEEPLIERALRLIAVSEAQRR